VETVPETNRFAKASDYYSSPRARLTSLLPNECKTILDVGCGTGAFWTGFQGSVTGIEIDPPSAAQASQVLSRSICGDIESLSDQEITKGSRFDCVVCADVLEHLYDPWTVMKRLASFLRPGGYVLASIPNIRHYSTLRALVFRRDFPYAKSGILDVDHVRFFTFKGMVDLLKQAGFDIVIAKPKISASNEYKILNGLFFGRLKDFLTEQYYFLAQLKKK
jgi:SAM-dependent methyltransferase